ncbi:MAG: SET domain-containing protein-lysine N-methyltransferase [Ignavibacteriae bacterium]|nr:SET domain-containing protein-lysine N-methyltransferase [Ignavibacteriota bacterium]
MKIKDIKWHESFEIKISSKEGAGRGVFTKRKILKGEHIGYYTGKILNAKQITREPFVSSLFILQVTKDHFIYGEGKESNFVSFINHSNKPNAELVVSTRWKKARIVAIKNIKIGEEIFYNYSDEYWRILEKTPK